MRRPLLFLLPAGAALVLLGFPFLNVNLGPIWSGALPEDAPARVGWELVTERFGAGELTPVVVAVDAPSGVFEPSTVGALFDYSRRIAALPGVTRVDSIVDVAPGIPKSVYQRLYADPDVVNTPEVQASLRDIVGGRTTMLRVFNPYPIVSTEAKEFVAELRRVELDGGLTQYVTGATASLQDSIRILYSDFPKAIAVVVASIYIALLLLFRSVVLPLKAIIMNSMSIFAAFGALVFVFQDGKLEWLLNFRSDGSVEASVPILLFCTLFGLSMDYELFLLSRVKEEYDRTGDNVSAVAAGMERSGRIITSAAMVVVLVGLAFSFGDVVIVKTVGFGLALAVFIDATIVRAVMVPSLMRLLGRWNWWAPRWLLRLLPRWEEATTHEAVTMGGAADEGRSQGKAVAARCACVPIRRRGRPQGSTPTQARLPW